MGPQAKPAMDAELQNELLSRARAAAEQAYVPYSEFPVGAAALAADGSIHAGCNIENASYGLTICAERTAVSAAIGQGHRQIDAVAVSAPKVPLTTPCGACRQFLNEFRPDASDMLIVLDDHLHGAAFQIHIDFVDLCGAQSVGHIGGRIIRPVHDVDLLTPQLLHH